MRLSQPIIAAALALAALCLALPSGSAADSASSTGNRYALLVGCTRYPNLPPRYQLKGPANDVALMAKLLTDRMGFSADSDHLVRLLDENDAKHQPTRDNIVREMTALVEKARRGDQIVILMGGHGSQEPNDDPENTEDIETDGLDEVFLPEDTGPWDSGEKEIHSAIRDDRLREWGKALIKKGASVWFIIDACHSGSMTRSMQQETLRQIAPEVLVPQEELDKARKNASQVSGSEAPDLDRVAEDEGGLVAMYAAQSTEPTVERPMPYDVLPGQEVSQQTYGLLTYTINMILSRSQSPLTYRELMQQVNQQYVQWGRVFPTPLIEGTAVNNVVLGKERWPERSRMLVQVTEDGKLYLNAGTLSGISPGSILKVFPPAGSEKADQPIGHVRVTAARVGDADIEPCEFESTPAPKVDDLVAGCRAELAYLDFGLRRLRTAVIDMKKDAAAADEVRHGLRSDTSLFEVVDDQSKADWVVRRDGPAVELVETSTIDDAGKSKAGDFPTPRATLAAGDAAAAWASERLERIARVRNLISLADPLDSTRVWGGDGVNVQITMVRYHDANDKEGEEIKWQKKGRVLNAGDRVGFCVKNLAAEPVDVTLLFIDSGYGITPFFPKATTMGDNRLGPKATWRSPRQKVTADTMGLEHMLVIAVRGEGPPMDFAWLSQPTMAAARGSSGTRGGMQSPLEKLLENAAFAGSSTRGRDRQSVDKNCIRLISWKVVDKPS